MKSDQVEVKRLLRDVQRLRTALHDRLRHPMDEASVDPAHELARQLEGILRRLEVLDKGRLGQRSPE